VVDEAVDLWRGHDNGGDMTRPLRRSRMLGVLCLIIAGALALPMPPASATLVATPNADWAVLAGSAATTPDVFDFDHDASGNSYVFGTIKSDLTLAGSPSIVVPTSPSGLSLFGWVASFDPAGSVRWASRISSGGGGVSPVAMAVEPTGATHVVVTAFDNVTFGMGATAITVTIPASGSYTMLASFDAAGVPVRAGIVSATGFMSAIDLTVSASGEVSLYASYSPGVTLPATLTPPAARGVVIIRYAANGAVRWALPHSGGNSIISDGHIVDDGNGNVALVEATEGTFTFGTGPGAGSFDLAHLDVVIARIDPNGGVQWTATRGGVADDRFTRLDVSPSGAIAVSWKEDPSFSSFDEFWTLAGYSAGGANSWNQTVVGEGNQTGLTVTSAGLTVATYKGFDEDSRFTFGTPPDQALIASNWQAMAAFDSSGALAWAGAPGRDISKIDANGAAIGVLATFTGATASTMIGEGAGAITVNAADVGNVVLGELSSSTGIASNLAVSIDPEPLAITGGSSTTTRVTMRNTGSTDAPAAHLALTTDTGLSITSTSPSQGSVTGLDWSAGTIASGASAFIDVTVTAAPLTGCLTPNLIATSTFAGYDTNLLDSTTSAPVRVTGTLTLPEGADWVKSGGSAASDDVRAGAADPRGGMVIAGSIGGDAVFGDDASAQWVSMPPEEQGMFLAAYDSAGALRSVTGGHAINGFANVADLGVDATGAVTAVGTFRGDLSFDNSSPPVTLVGSTTTTSGFLAHWNPDMTLAWAIPIAGSTPRVAVAPTGEIFLGSAGSISRFASTGGAPVWTRSFSSSSQPVIDDLVVDASLAPLVTVTHGDNLVAGTFTIASSGSMLAQLASNGVPQWVNPVTKRASTSQLAFVAGGDIARNHTGTNGGAFVERYTSAGVLIWSRQVSTTTPMSSSSMPMPIGSSPDGAIFVGGRSFARSPSQPFVDEIGEGSGWWARVDSTGTIVALVRTPGMVRALGVDVDGRLLVGGEFRFNAGISPPACTIADDDAFVAKYQPAFNQPHLKGTITAPDSSPAAGVTVTVMYQWPSWTVRATTVTALDGTYDVPVLPGTYRIRFFDGQGRFARRWWNAVSTYKVAGELAVDWNVDAIADQQLDAVEGGAIRGFVTDETTSDPVLTARVQIFNANGYVAGATVNAFGHFNVMLPAGSYWVRYVDSTRRLYSSWFGGAHDFPSAVPVVVGTTPVTADGTLGPWPTA